MNILLNALPLKGLLTGIPRYLRCLYGELERLSGASVTYFTGTESLSEMPSQAEPRAWCKATESVWRLPDAAVAGLRSAQWLAYEASLRRACRRRTFHVCHEAAFVPPAVANVPIVYTLHDLSLMHCRKEHPRERAWFFDLFFKRRLPYASHIVTVSRFMRNRIMEDLGVPPERVTAIAEAAAPHFRPRSPEDVAKTLERNGWPREYVLFVGTLEPRKNLSLLIRALAATKHRPPLVLAGWSGWGEKEWMRWIDGRETGVRVYRAGYVDEETLAVLYSGALVLVYPSFYEGFGLPVLEAMSCGCPVVACNASSIPEVAGDAALLVDPRDAEALAHALDLVLEDSALARAMRDKGFERAKRFSWKEAAQRTLEVFSRVAQEKSPS